LIYSHRGRKVLEHLAGRGGVDVIFEPMQACCAVWTDAWDQGSEVCGVGESEEGQV
jgi:hypothetical protein